MAIEVLSQFNVPEAPESDNEVARIRDVTERRDIPVITVSSFSYANLQAAGLETYKTYLVKDDTQEYFVYRHPQLGFLCFGVNLGDVSHAYQPLLQTKIITEQGTQDFPFTMRSETVLTLTPATVTGIYLANDENAAQIYSGANPTVLTIYKEG
jgi:hypothetical protein